MGAERIVFIVSDLSNDLVRVVTPSRRSCYIWLSVVHHGLWSRLLQQLSGLLPLASYDAY
jgi:hypothetical protein